MKSLVLVSLLAVLCNGCASTQLGQVLDVNTNYRMEIHMRVQGGSSKEVLDAVGTMVVPHDFMYHVWAETKDKPDIVALNTCHREVTMPAGYDKLTYDYIPTRLESNESCQFHLATYSQKIWYRGGLIDFEDPVNFPVKAALTCNGTQSVANGVAICQAKAGLMQQLVFEKPMNIGAAKPSCAVMVPSSDFKTWSFDVVSGECMYKFGEKDVPGNKFKLTTYGYDQYLIPPK